MKKMEKELNTRSSLCIVGVYEFCDVKMSIGAPSTVFSRATHLTFILKTHFFRISTDESIQTAFRDFALFLYDVALVAYRPVTR
jgi:hypothetical protein